MKAVVTGGAGFLGSHVAKALAKAGHDLTVVDDFSSGSQENLEELGVRSRVLVGDLEHYPFARDSLKGADAVFHFAADVGNVEYLHGSGSKEMAALRNNMAIDTNVIRACAEVRVGTIIYASSVSVYQKSKQMGQRVAFREEDTERTVEPEGGYGLAKFIAERQLAALPRTRVGVARIFHAYGPNIYLKEDRSQVMGSLIRKAVRHPREKFVVWGDGTQRRAFLYVDDFLDALRRLQRRVEEGESVTVNVGSTEEVTVGRLAEMVIGLSGKEIHLEFDPSKPTGVLSRVPDLDRARRVLGWGPTTKLGDGLSRTYRWAERRLS